MNAPRRVRFDDTEYPAGLCRLADAPPVLFVEGSLEGLERAVGIVGTRRATAAALAVTRTMARELAERGVLVVSGGAEGIDRAAHEGALDAPGGRTLGVLPTALDAPYPRSHASLFERIASRGARLTEHERSSSIHRAHFLQRNRIIAALSRVVVVVQAPSQSGALRTAADAAALGVPVLAVPWSPLEPAAAGSVALLVSGVRACRSAEDVLATMGEPIDTPRPAKKRRQLRLHGTDARALLAALDETALDRDTAFTRAGLPIARAQAALAELVIDGEVLEDAFGLRRVRT